MYKISVPVIVDRLERTGRDRVLEHLKSLNAERVFLALGEQYHKDEAKTEALMACVKDNASYFHAHSLEVGTWLWTFGYKEENDFIHMESPSGKVSSETVCPSDSRFVNMVCAYLEKLAATGVDLIMFDDDFRYGFVEGLLCCTCKNHRAKMEELLGEKLPEGPLSELIFAGGKNKFRSAFLKANRFYFEEFAKACRAAVDRVNPKVRLGLCGCITTWDFDGISADEIARLLAGPNTAPFLRLIGAPYWGARRSFGGTRLQHAIEYIRMEKSWCGEGIEIFSEGDTYPRPRFVTPASFLEAYDTVLRADGKLDGILKYAIDYYATADYETGYVTRHVRNRPLYGELDKTFAPKAATGVRNWEFKNKFEQMDVPAEVAGQDRVQYQFFSPAAKMFSDLSIPLCYEGTGVCGVAFGENARHLPPEAFEKGLFLDLRAAEILSSLGVDVGLERVEEGQPRAEEHFLDPDEYASAFALAASSYPVITLKEGARVDSVYRNLPNEDVIPACWFYENRKGQRFFVFGFHAHYCSKETVWRNYARQRQIHKAVKWLCGEELPARIPSCPDLYLLAKTDGKGKLAVGLWNLCPDDVPAPAVTLAKPYFSVRGIGCEAVITGNTVTLSRLEPYGFAGFEVIE